MSFLHSATAESSAAGSRRPPGLSLPSWYGSRGRRWLVRQIDSLFGYDFFLSYAHADGMVYPLELRRALTSRRFSVFLDDEVYAPGDDLSAATLRRVGQSRRLVLIYGPQAVRSPWVRREVEAYVKRPDVPLLIEWDATLATDPEALWLRGLLGDSITIREPIPRPDTPSPQTVERLIRSFRVRRIERIRTAVVAAAALVFAVLAILAWFQRSRAVAETRRAVSARLAMESSLALGRDPQQAVGAALCAMSYEPLPVARESLTAAVRATWGVERVFRARSGSLREAVLVPATGTVIAAGQTGQLWTWARGAAEPVVHRLLDDDLTALALTVDGRHLLVGSGRGKLLILDAISLAPVWPPLALHGAGVTRILALGPRLIATVSYDDQLVFLDPEAGTVVARPPAFHQPGSLRLGIQDAAYDPVRRRIVTAGADGRLALWDVADPRRTRLLTTAGSEGQAGQADSVWFAVACEPIRGLVAAGDGSGKLRIWRELGERLSPLDPAVVDAPATTERLIAGLTFDSAAGLLAVARSDGSFGLWDVAGDPAQGDLPGPLLESVAHGSAVNRATFLPDGRALTAGDDGHVVLWRFLGAAEPALPVRPTRGSQSEAVLAHGGAFVASWDDRNTVRVTDLSSRRTVGKVPYEPRIRLWTAAVSGDGERLATGDETGTVRVWATRTARPLSPPLALHGSNVTALAFDPVASRWLLSGAVDGSVALIRLDGSVPTARALARLDAQVTGLAVSGDGSIVATVPSTRGSARLWCTQDWRECGQVAVAPGSGIRDAALDQDGRRLALADRWGAVLLFERRSNGWDLRRLAAHGGQVRAVAFSPNGKLLASGGDDGRVVVWNAATGERQWALPRAVTRYVDGLAWSPKGSRLVALGDDGAVVSWPFALSWWIDRASLVAPNRACTE
jgi:WD40 repeat protein